MSNDNSHKVDPELEQLALEILGRGHQSFSDLPDYAKYDAERIVRLITNRVTEEVEKQTPVTIMGKTIDEIVVILSALELERIADMKMTMSHLDDWMKLVRDDHRKATQKAMDRMIEATLNKGKDGE